MFVKRILCIFLAFAVLFSFAGCRSRTTKQGDVKTSSAQIKANVENQQLKNEESEKPEPVKNKAKVKQSSSSYMTGSSPKLVSAAKSAGNRLKSSSADDNKKGSGGNKTGAKTGNIRDESGGEDKDSKSQDLDVKDSSQQETPTQTAIKEYSTLLSSSVSNVEACHRYEVYCEKEDYAAFNDKNIIYNAGGINIDKTKTDITASWITRKNPRVIVKFVEKDVLGSGVNSNDKAEEIMNSLLLREGWSGVEAIENKRVLLLSSSLLETQAGRTLASLITGKMLHFALFGDIDINEAYRKMFSKEIDGTYYYVNNQYQYDFSDIVL